RDVVATVARRPIALPGAVVGDDRVLERERARDGVEHPARDTRVSGGGPRSPVPPGAGRVEDDGGVRERGGRDEAVLDQAPDASARAPDAALWNSVGGAAVAAPAAVARGVVHERAARDLLLRAEARKSAARTAGASV